jgi:hypothetical protein
MSAPEVFQISLKTEGGLNWERVIAPDVRNNVLALALTSNRTLIAGAESGMVAVDLPANPYDPNDGPYSRSTVPQPWLALINES